MSSLQSRMATFFTLSWFAIGPLTIVISLVACLAGLPRTWALLGLSIHLGSLLLPLQTPAPAWAQPMLTHILATICGYFPMTVQLEDKDAFKSNRPVILGYEPHSVLPIGACVFVPFSPMRLPPSLTDCHMAATSAAFFAPFLRNLLYWFGWRPASRESLQNSLASGTSVVICPGGVAECCYMDQRPGREVAFLRRRTGFVRLAMQSGTPIVPVWAFGQSAHYSYWRPFIDWPQGVISPGTVYSFVRFIGFVPLLMWGWLGSPMPRQVPMHIVVGRPIEVPQRSDPSQDEVQQYLQQYIAALTDLFERHKASAGHQNDTLTVI